MSGLSQDFWTAPLLAQLNVARTLAPIDDPLLADFVADLDRINGVAEASPGFVWRLKDESGNATGYSVAGDPDMIVNLSLWRSREELHAFTYRSDHRRVFARRREWFRPLAGPHLVLWWHEGATPPTVDEAFARLDRLRHEGPGPLAFGFRDRYAPPSTSPAENLDSVVADGA